MLPVNLKRFAKKLSLTRRSFRKFLNATEKNPPPNIDKLTPIIEAEVWREIDCVTCANCCKVMTPTFTAQDLKRIAPHFGQTPKQFSAQWLKKDSNNDMVNKIQPCQFLNLHNNLCTIYSIRPADCAGFPHLSKRKWEQYAHVHKQNIDYCPATHKMVEKMIDHFNAVG